MKFATGAIAAVLALGAPALADEASVSSKSRMALFENQMRVLDGRAIEQYARAVRTLPNSVHVPARYTGPRYAGSYRGRYLELARRAARAHAIPEDLFLRLVQQESNWNPRAVSHKGARGLAQLMPGTARMLGVNADDPVQNLDGGARYLRGMYDRFRDWRLALAAYNAGPGAVERHAGVPPFRETQGYVRAILGE